METGGGEGDEGEFSNHLSPEVRTEGMARRKRKQRYVKGKMNDHGVNLLLDSRHGAMGGELGGPKTPAVPRVNLTQMRSQCFT